MVPGSTGMAIMQSLNQFGANPLFGLGFWGGAILALVSAALALTSRCEGWVAPFTGCMLYLIGGVLLSLVVITPLSDELAVLSPQSAHGAGVWLDYLRDWSLFNQMRTVLCMAAAGCALTPLVRMPMSYWRVAG